MSILKKKVIIGICVLLAIILLVPIPVHLKDGGTIIYKAMVYQVEKAHRMVLEDISEDGYEDGTIIRIFGIEIYNDVK